MWPSLDREPATLTDSLVRGGATALIRHPDHLVYDTPGRRDFWYGSYVECKAGLDLKHLEASLCIWDDHFKGEVGIVKRILSWEVRLAHELAVPVPFEYPEGAELETASVLVADRAALSALPSHELETGEVARPARTDLDFDRILQLDLADARLRTAEGFSESFARWRFDQVVATTQAEPGEWWMLESEGELVATCGMCYRGPAARFRQVMTHPLHRGRGYARRLCAFALRSALARAETERVVIVADGDSTAERVYRTVGMREFSTQMSLIWAL